MFIYTACYDVVALNVALDCYPWVTVGEGDAAWRSCGRPAPKIRPSPLVVDADRYLCLARSNYLLSLGIRLGLGRSVLLHERLLVPLTWHRSGIR